MAKYTVELGTLIKANFDIGLKDYPIYKEELRKPLNDLIIEHFYFREIGLETPQLFKRFLNRKMNEIMPYYNQLYKSEDLEFNPLYNIELKETYTQTGINKNKLNTTGETNSNSTINNTSKSKADNENILVDNDTPQSGMSEEDIRANTYASNIKRDVNKGTSENTDIGNQQNNETVLNNVIGDSQSDMEYTKETKGSSAGLSFSKAIDQWRKIMININAQILEELEPLFMQIW